MVSPCCRHKPFGVTAILVRMSLMSVISIFYVGHYRPATLVHAGLRLSLQCTVRVNDPMHVRFCSSARAGFGTIHISLRTI